MNAHDHAARHLLKNVNYKPEVGIVCGSGLSELSRCLMDAQSFNYIDIPGFPHVDVEGHSNQLVFGTIGDIKTVCMKGRFHFFEGSTMEQIVLPIRTMRALGVKLLIVTNAAGGLNPAFNVGDIMIMQDHIGMPCLAGNTPLRGENNDELGPRFPAMSDAYDPELQSIVLNAAADLGIADKVRQSGTYCFSSGPDYGSKCEARFLRSLGGDSKGMSTVPEIIVAKHCGMKVLGLSLITAMSVVNNNTAAAQTSHSEVLAAVAASGLHVEAIVKRIVTKDIIGAYLAALPDAPSKLTSDIPDVSEDDSGRYKVIEVTIDYEPTVKFESVLKGTALFSIVAAAVVAAVFVWYRRR